MTACCMGGFCPKRDACADYHERAEVVAERLCPKGAEEPRPMARFDAWLAGATPEQAARWHAMQGRNAATQPVTDEQLPAPLRGGALEVF